MCCSEKVCQKKKPLCSGKKHWNEFRWFFEQLKKNNCQFASFAWHFPKSCRKDVFKNCTLDDVRAYRDVFDYMVLDVTVEMQCLKCKNTKRRNLQQVVIISFC